MSLFDVDKAGDARTKPLLNASDVLPAGSVKAHATEGTAYRTEDTASAPKTTSNDDRITVSDGVNTRIVLGRLPDGSYGLIITKEGYDVEDVFS